MNLEIRLERLSGSKLVDDYQEADPALAPFFSGSPTDPDSYRRKLVDVDRRFDSARRSALVEFVRPTTPGAAERLEQVTGGEAVMVTTGQQPGLLTGPLYTLYKALSAVRLAAALEPVLGRPVIPAFWIAADDHDWAEVNRASFLDTENELRVLGLGERSETAAPMNRQPVGGEIERVLDDLAELLPDNDFAPALLTQIREAYTPDASMAAAFGTLLETLLNSFDLLTIQASHPDLKHRGSSVLKAALEDAEREEELLARQTESLEQAGYPAQVPVLPGATNVFMLNDGSRERLFRDGDEFTLRRSGRKVSRSEVLELLDTEPERFSPNVVLRPVLENALLPTVAYVAGPGELAYYAQLGCLFSAHGIRMPVAYPRHSITIIESKVRKVLDKFSLNAEDFRRPVHELAGGVLREELPTNVTDALRGLRADLGRGYAQLETAARDIDPTLRGPVGQARSSAFAELERLEKKMATHLERQEGIALDQLRKAATNLYPGGSPQERELNGLHYLARYGPDLLPEIAGRMEVAVSTPAPDWTGDGCG